MKTPNKLAKKAALRADELTRGDKKSVITSGSPGEKLANARYLAENVREENRQRKNYIRLDYSKSKAHKPGRF